MATPQDYVELRSRSSFSFLEGASNPEDLTEAAAALGVPTLAMADRNGVSGAPRFHRAAKAAGIRALLGAELTIAATTDSALTPCPSNRILLLVESSEGWRRLCRLLSLAHSHRDKRLEARDPRARDRIQIQWDDLEKDAGHWSVLLRGDENLQPMHIERAQQIFGNRLSVDVSRLLDRRMERIARRAAAMASSHSVQVVATGNVRCATPRDRRLLDALICLRERRTLETAGRILPPNGEGTLHSREEMVRRFSDQPEFILATRAIAERC
ncbi:MAG: PHP domain-containing protein, partial [Myxococcota bacterium]